MQRVEERLDGEDLNSVKHIGAPSCVNANPLSRLDSLELFERSEGAFPFPVPFFGAFHFDRNDLSGFASAAPGGFDNEIHFYPCRSPVISNRSMLSGGFVINPDLMKDEDFQSVPLPEAAEAGK